MAITRTVEAAFPGKPMLEGAGVHLKRGFSFGMEKRMDPFLLFDDFSGDDPEKFMKGFPWHPHRGIETITYLLEGDVEHGDSLGNAGIIHPGEVQWMTAGSGIIHQEMPVQSETGKLIGFQLWANLPASQKMMPPRYRGITAEEIPVIDAPNATIRLVSGTIGEVQGPAKDIVIEPEYLDVTVKSNEMWVHPTPPGHTVFAYLIQGSADFEQSKTMLQADKGMVVIFSDGDQVAISAGENGARFLLISGKPLREPIAWGGPIVMNTEEELRTAFAEYRAGTFIKHKSEI